MRREDRNLCIATVLVLAIVVVGWITALHLCTAETLVHELQLRPMR